MKRFLTILLTLVLSQNLKAAELHNAIPTEKTFKKWQATPEQQAAWDETEAALLKLLNKKQRTIWQNNVNKWQALRTQKRNQGKLDHKSYTPEERRKQWQELKNSMLASLKTQQEKDLFNLYSSLRKLWRNGNHKSNQIQKNPAAKVAASKA